MAWAPRGGPLCPLRADCPLGGLRLRHGALTARMPAGAAWPRGFRPASRGGQDPRRRRAAPPRTATLHHAALWGVLRGVLPTRESLAVRALSTALLTYGGHPGARRRRHPPRRRHRRPPVRIGSSSDCPGVIIITSEGEKKRGKIRVIESVSFCFSLRLSITRLLCWVSACIVTRGMPARQDGRPGQCRRSASPRLRCSLRFERGA